MILSDIHVHTTYCDGKSTVDEIVKKAISINMTSIGFSSHENVTFDPLYCMTVEDTQKYIDDVNTAKERYKDKIQIYLGTEKDYLGTPFDYNFDYTIGSVHYFKMGDKYYAYDLDPEEMIDVVSSFFDGDYMKYVKMYYEDICKMAEARSFDVVGHLNLVTKFNNGNKFFDENSKEYQSLAYEAIKEVSKHCDIFEMNTGAISRGYTKIPYPDSFMLKCIKDIGGKIVITSDSHIKDTLCFKFDDCIEILKSVGYESVVTLSDGKFVEQGI